MIQIKFTNRHFIHIILLLISLFDTGYAASTGELFDRDNINIKDDSGYTPLFKAAKRGASHLK